MTENKNEYDKLRQRSQRKDRNVYKTLFLFATTVFSMMKLLQWRFQEVLDASIPIWAPKLKP